MRQSSPAVDATASRLFAECAAPYNMEVFHAAEGWFLLCD